MPWYFRLMAVHFGQMNELKITDLATWERLKTDCVVTKSTLAFCMLFVYQNLEPEIEELKRYGHLPGITQDEDAMDRFVITSPHLANYFELFLWGFPKYSQTDQTPDVYHQLKGNLFLRCAMNSTRICDIIVSFCQGNPFIKNTQLMNMTKGVVIPEKPADDILNYAEKGQTRYDAFIQTRLLPGSQLSVEDTLPQLKLKRFSTWMKAKTVKVGDKVKS